MVEGQDSQHFAGFRHVPRTGVIYVMSEAREQGFEYGNPAWANLGQGAPECGSIEGQTPRIEQIPIALETREYGPVAGINDLRDAVAHLYNVRYRRGMKSQYSAENVAISAGGRSGLTRVAAALGNINLGHFLPDYTAYEELLEIFKAFVSIPILLRSEDGFDPSTRDIAEDIAGKGLGAMLISNPCNPTGKCLHGSVLADWVGICRSLMCTFILDEFYAHYIYDDLAEAGPAISAAAYVEDVEKDPIVILDGLTKNWRYPGLRLSWTVGPKQAIKRFASAGSFLDGGAPHPIQRTAIPLLDPIVANQEARAIQKHFNAKRAYMVNRLKGMGFGLLGQPQGTFYCFASLQNLPEELRDGMSFFRAALARKVITVPGVFFDVNPGKRRRQRISRLNGFARLSFGPPLEELKLGLDQLEDLLG